MSLEMYKINREDVNRQQEGGEGEEVTLQQPRRRAIRRTKGSLRQSKQQPLQRIGSFVDPADVQPPFNAVFCQPEYLVNYWGL